MGEEVRSLVGGGWGGIRTPGPLRVNGFQDRRIRPLCHPSAPRRQTVNPINRLAATPTIARRCRPAAWTHAVQRRKGILQRETRRARTRLTLRTPSANPGGSNATRAATDSRQRPGARPGALAPAEPGPAQHVLAARGHADPDG